jgi:hypothetical protein
MKLIPIKDLQDFTFNINPSQITRVEKYPKSNKIIVYFSDGFGLQTNMSLQELNNLIQD